jgi:hypothetical protein
MNQISLDKVRKSIDFMQMESWEAGHQNWTQGFEEEFEKRNGYSIIPWLPTLTKGVIINSEKESNKFLWDLRNTIVQLIAEN